MGDIDFLTVNTTCLTLLAKTEINGAVHFDYVNPVGVSVSSFWSFTYDPNVKGDARYFKKTTYVTGLPYKTSDGSNFSTMSELVSQFNLKRQISTIQFCLF